MKIVVLGGYGEMGSVAARDLCGTFSGDIIIAGRDEGKAKRFASSFRSRRITGAYADTSDKGSMDKVLGGADAVINATNYYHNIEVMEHALRNGTNYLDLGGLYHTTLKQLRLHGQFKRRKVLALLGCGSTPGITNIMAAHAARAFDSIESISIQFGDRDHTDYGMPFVVPYSMYTVIDEFSKRPAVFTGGLMKFVEPLSGEAMIDFPKPVGRINCFYTLHSELASLPRKFKDKGIMECSFRGGFDREFVRYTKFLIDTGFASGEPVSIGKSRVRPVDMAVKLLDRFMPPKDVKINDVEMLRVAIKGRKKGRRSGVAMYCKAVTSRKWNVPAGSWDTGVAPSVLAQMIAGGRIDAHGVLTSDDECIDSGYFFAMLKRRDMKVFSAHL
ncbi:MAG: saccharopine dehydrogenase family protein [Candidatus Micrarchaeaceae archaeon]